MSARRRACSGEIVLGVVGTGIGAKRLFVVGEEVEDDVSLAYPTLRLVVGYAF